ncbi:MAG: N-acyl homoserine lactonase family protein [bacterium]
MRIHAIQTGTVSVHELQRSGHGRGLVRALNTMRDTHWTPALPIFTWVIEHPEGVIVVDSGDTSRTATPGYFPRWHPYFRWGVRIDVTPEEEIGPQLRLLGISTSDVRTVIMTHLHTDHAGGLSHFPDSDIFVDAREYEVARGIPGMMRGYLPHRWPDWFAPRPMPWMHDDIGPFDRCAVITRAGDVRVLPTPGHSAGHASVLVTVSGEPAVLLAGDVSYTQENLLADVVDGVSPLGGGEAAARRSLARVRGLAREMPLVFLPTHDEQSAVRLAERRAIPRDLLGEA